ncbi:MAG: DUF4276 family protein [Planctomycetaceae bacterium]|nr:DUF4276 family protein [Planctomycetaceae bacterium]
MKRRLVLFGEGEGDKSGGYWLTKAVLTELGAWDHVAFQEKDCLKAGDLGGLIKNNFARWHTLLRHAQRKPNLGAVLLLLDGDTERKVLKRAFCARDFALELAQSARAVGAATAFSVAVVFACQEFETWFIAGVESLAGKTTSDGMPGIKTGTKAPAGDLEQTIRGAKQWLSRHMPQPYKPPLYQGEFAKIVRLDQIRARNLKSFRRYENALRQIAEACRTNEHVSTPFTPPQVG